MLKDIKFSDASVQVVDSAIDTQLLDENKALRMNFNEDFKKVPTSY